MSEHSVDQLGDEEDESDNTASQSHDSNPLRALMERAVEALNIPMVSEARCHESGS